MPFAFSNYFAIALLFSSASTVLQCSLRFTAGELPFHLLGSRRIDGGVLFRAGQARLYVLCASLLFARELLVFRSLEF